MWFKALVAATCVAVLAAIGYYFYGEWQGREADAARERAVEAAQIAQCRALAADLTTVLQGGSLGRRFVQHEARAELRRCVALGRLDVAEAETLGL